MQTTKIFLASSQELKEDRREFEIFVNRKNKSWVSHGVFLELVVWEDFLDAVSQTRLQDEYNKAIRDCDIFVMLFFTKVGKYTEEEFETAFGQFKATNKPLIFTYFKEALISVGSANEDDLMSLWAFKKKLAALGHFTTVYKNVDELKFQFDHQLDELTENGSIKLDSAKDVSPAAAAPLSTMPHLAHGGWTLRNAIDDDGVNWSNSVLKFSSQQPDAEGLLLRGAFTWRRNNDLVGTEEVTGHYIAATRQIILEGEGVSDPVQLAVGSYSASLSMDERELSDGRWGSSAQQRDAGTPGRWEASR
jgi:hypothetical protein